MLSPQFPLRCGLVVIVRLATLAVLAVYWMQTSRCSVSSQAPQFTVKIVPCGHRCWCICCEWSCSLMSPSKSCSSLVYYAEITIRLTWFPFEEVIQGSELLASYTCPASCLDLRRIAQLSAVRHRLLAFVSSHVLLYNYHCLHLLKYLVSQIKALLSSISMFSHVYPPRKIGRVPVDLHW